MNLRRPIFVRLFCVWCALVILPLAPVAVATLGSVRRHPMPFSSSGGAITAIRFGAAPFVPVSSPEARRRFRNAPVGSEITYRLRDGRTVSGRVTSVAADRATLVRRSVLALLTLVSILAGLALALAGQNRAALHAAGFLAGAGATLGFGFLEPNLVHIDSRAWRDAIIALYALVPAALWCRYLLLLAADLPNALPIGRGMRAVIHAVSFLAIARSLLFAWSQIGAIFDRVPAAAAIASLVEGALLQSVPYVVTVAAALLLVVRQLRMQASEEMAKRARVVAHGFFAGIGIPLAALLLQFVSLLATSRLAMQREVMAVLLLPLVLVPVSLTYALLARRVERTGVLARRALVFAVGDRALLAIALLIVALLFATRSYVALVAIAALALARVARKKLERAFFRDDRDASRVLHDFAQRVQSAGTAGARARTIEEAVTAALRIESAVVFTPEPSWRIAALRDITDVDATFLATLPAMERQWLEQRQTRLVVPIHRNVLALGEKMNGLPFDGQDRLLLGAIAGTAALALDRDEARAPIAPAEDPELARLCPTCAAVTDPLLAARCSGDDTPLVAAAVPLVLHGKFRFERRLGAGSMGVVYRARDLALGRDVAVKTLPAVSPDDVVRFEREAHAAAALSHPSIATIHGAESWRGRPMLIFELLDGGTLADRIRYGPLALDDVVRIGVAICDALAHAHAHGVLHRDIKPSNVGFDAAGTPKVLDFGLAGFLHDGSMSTVAGTPRYLAPEIILGHVATPHADLWSAAVTLYEALTGEPPFSAPTPTLTMNRILGESAADPRTLRPDVPAPLAEQLMRALQRRPEERFANAAAMRDALTHALSR